MFNNLRLPDPVAPESGIFAISREIRRTFLFFGPIVIIFGFLLSACVLKFGDWNTAYKYRVVQATYKVDPPLRRYAIYKVSNLKNQSTITIISKSRAWPPNLKPSDVVEKKSGEIGVRVNDIRTTSKLSEMFLTVIIPTVSVFTGLTLLVLGMRNNR